jgi:hypothetical protein
LRVTRRLKIPDALEFFGCGETQGSTTRTIEVVTLTHDGALPSLEGETRIELFPFGFKYSGAARKVCEAKCEALEAIKR